MYDRYFAHGAQVYSRFVLIKRIAWGCVWLVVIIIGTLYFLIKFNHPFWKYP